MNVIDFLKKIQFLVFSFGCYFVVIETHAQDSVRFSYLEFMEQVMLYHPIMRQANLLPESARAQLQEARGNFDPKIASDLNQKYYKDKHYFRIIQNQIKVPTRLGGIEFAGGYDLSEGDYLSPENTLPTNGLAYAGVSVPIGQGLWIDERRAALQQAKVFQKQTEAEQKLLILNNLNQAGKFYLDWMESYYQQQIAQDAVRLAQIRLDGMREGFRVGNDAAIDTTEALIELQTRQLTLLEAQNDFQMNSQKLSVFLWDKNGVPIEFAQVPMPDAPDDFEYSHLISQTQLDSIIENLHLHPKILKYQYKLQTLDIDRRFYTDKFKPKVKVKYHHLFQEINAEKDAPTTPTTNNFKWGFQFDYPILLRKERGKLNKTKVKISSTELELQYERQSLIAKLQNYQNKLNILAEQIVLYQDAVRNYDRLVAGENVKFNMGESYLFLVNKREVKQVEARLKLLSLKVKYQKIWLDFYEASGDIPL